MDPVGIGAAGIVLVVGVAGGMWRRRTDGRLRRVSTPPGEQRSVLISAGGRGGEASRGVGRGGVAPAGDGRGGDALLGGGRGGEAPSGGGRGGEVPSGDGRGGEAWPGGGRAGEAAPGGGGRDAGEAVDPAVLRELGVGPARATLLQFSSAFCAPCRAVRRVSAEVAGMVPGVRHVEIDAESHLAAVRALEIWRTPTLLILDADGRIVRRATGVPGKAQLIAALGEVLL